MHVSVQIATFIIYTFLSSTCYTQAHFGTEVFTYFCPPMYV